MSISRSNIKLQVTRGNKMKNLKDVPEGNKGKGLSKLPTSVRNNMGFKKNGGSLEEDIKKIKSKKASELQAAPSKKASEMQAAPSTRPSKRGAIKKSRGALGSSKRKQIMKRKGGGMAYQLYGGSTKDFSNGNKFIQSFYDKGGK